MGLSSIVSSKMATTHFFNQVWEIGPQAWDRSFNPQAWELAGIELSDLQSRQSILWKGSGQSPRELKELPLEHITLIIDFTTNFEHWGCILNKFPYHLNLSEQSDIHWDIKMSRLSEFTATK